MISKVNLQHVYPKSDVYVDQCLLKRLIKLCHSIQALIQYPHKPFICDDFVHICVVPYINYDWHYFFSDNDSTNKHTNTQSKHPDITTNKHTNQINQQTTNQLSMPTKKITQ